MKMDLPAWMTRGMGKPPDTVHSFRTEAAITGCEAMLEAEQLVVTDEIGTLYRLDPLLNVELLTRLQEPVSQLSWSENGQFGSALLGTNVVIRIDRDLKVVWTIELPFKCKRIAIDPYGVFTIATSEDGGAILLDDRAKKAATFESMKPLTHAEFLIEEPVVIAAADHGLLGAYSIGGKKIWEEALWSNVSDIAIAQKSAQISLAVQNLGLQIYNGQGESLNSIVVEGTTSHVATNFLGQESFVSTFERHLYRIDSDGSLLWAGTCEHDLLSIDAHPILPIAYFSTNDHRIVRIEWD